MTRKQFAMFIKVLRETCEASLNGDLYSIRPRVGSVYELCYQPIEKVIWGNNNCIIVNLLYEADYSYINYKNILKRFLIQKAGKEDWVKDYLIKCGIIKQGEKK